MDDHAWRFINDHDLIVFVADIKRKLFGDDLFAMGFFIGIDYDLVERSDLVVRLYLFIVDQDHAGLQRFLNLVAGGAFDPPDKEFIDAQRLLSLVDFQVEPFVQLLGTVCGGVFVFFFVPLLSLEHNPNFCKVSYLYGLWSEWSLKN